MMHRLYLALLGIALTLPVLIAPIAVWGTNDVSITVDRSAGTVDDVFQLTISVSADDLVAEHPAELASSSDFSVLSQAKSSRISVINGQVSQEVTFDFALSPRADLPAGKYQLPSITIARRGGTTIHSAPTIEILAGRVRPSQNGDDANIQFSQTVSSKTPYVGEQILYQLKYFAPGDTIPEQISDFEADGFWREMLSEDRTRIHGASRRSTRIIDESIALFPTLSGEKSIAKRTLTVQVPRISKQTKRGFPFGGGFGTDDFFADFFSNRPFMQMERKRVIAPEVKLSVRPLPPHPDANSSYVPVGKVSLANSIDRESLEVGETATLQLELYGDANLRPLSVELPKSGSSNFQVYPAPPRVETIVQAERVYFRKTFQFAIVPMVPGKIVIPALQILTFDPESENYRVLSSSARTLTVGGNATLPAGQTNANQSVNENPTEDLQQGPTVEQNTRSSRDLLELASQFFRRDRDRLPPQLWILGIFLVGLTIFALRLRRVKSTIVTPATVLVALQSQSKELPLDEVLAGVRRFGELLTSSTSLKWRQPLPSIPEELLSYLAIQLNDREMVREAKLLQQRIEQVRYSPSGQDDPNLSPNIISFLSRVSQLVMLKHSGK